MPWLDGILGKGVLGLWVRAYASITFVSLSVAVVLRGRRKVSELQAEPRWNPWGVTALLFTACSAIQFYLAEYTLSGHGMGTNLWGTESDLSPLKFAILQSIYFTAPLLASVCALVGLIRVGQLGRRRPEARTCEFSLACMAIFWVWYACSFYSFASSLQRFQSLTASLNDYAKNHQNFPHSLADLSGAQDADNSIVELIPDVQFNQQVEFETQFFGLQEKGPRVVLSLKRVIDGRRYAYTSDQKVVHFSNEQEFDRFLEASIHPTSSLSGY